MGQRSSRGLRTRVVAVWLVASMPLFVFALISGRDERALVEARYQDDLSRLVLTLSAEQRRIVEETRQLLFVLSLSKAIREGDPATCSALLAEVRARYPRYANLGAVTSDGEVFASALPMESDVSVSDNRFFRRALKTLQFSMGEYHIGEISRKPVLTFAYPVAPDGKPTYVLYAALDLDYLARLEPSGALPASCSVTIVDDSGTVLMRRPDAGSRIGTELGGEPLFQALSARKGAGEAEAVDIDGVRRVFAFSRLDGDSGGDAVSIAVGVPLAEIEAEVDASLRKQVLLILAFTLAGLVLAWLVGDRLILGVFGKVWDLSIRDSLTGLYNRRRAAEVGNEEVEQASRDGRELAALYLDVDHFKSVNDRYGHAVGDEVLREIALRCLRCTRTRDTVARFGGEEFLFLLPGSGREEAISIAERIRSSIGDRPFPTAAGDLPITASIGIAVLSEVGGAFADLVKRADGHLYRAKESGRNRVCAAEP